MNNLEQSSPPRPPVAYSEGWPRSAPRNRKLALLFLAVSFIGFLDATYLTAKYYLHSPLRCPIFGNCEFVTTSRYAVFAPGFPVALFGALYYLIIFLMATAYLDSGREKIFRLTAQLTPIGFLATLWLLYVQAFLLQAFCFYCLVSAISSIILFLLGLGVMIKGRSSTF